MTTSAHPFLPLIAETVAATGASEVLRIGLAIWDARLPLGASMTVREALESGGAQGRRELAIAALAADSGARVARQLIAAMRDLMARQLLVFVPEKLLDDTALLGLGLTRQARYEIDGVSWQAWSYDIRSYKSVPDWLNPRFWANPENWNKYRW